MEGQNSAGVASFRADGRDEPNRGDIRLILCLDYEPNKWHNRLMFYNWQQSDWPEFRYDTAGIAEALLAIAQETGHVSGLLKGLPEDVRTETILDLMVTEAVKTSEIEGEYISRADVMSSIRNQLGLNPVPEQIRDRRAKGAAALMLAVREHYAAPLTETMLFDWHKMLMEGERQITIGAWRTHAEPMQVISDLMHKPTVHFEAPPSGRVPEEMARFIAWFNATENGKPQAIAAAPVRAALAHLYFETIHPFEDGNGRIGRAISEKALAQGLKRPALLSLSKAIEANKKTYYAAIQQAQTSNEVSAWIEYFVKTVLEAQEDAGRLITFVLQKARFFDRYQLHLNERQLKVIRRMLDEEVQGFEGGMSAKKYVSLTAASKATATRDLQHLAEIGAFIPMGGGRSVRYEINLAREKAE